MSALLKVRFVWLYALMFKCVCRISIACAITGTIIIVIQILVMLAPRGQSVKSKWIPAKSPHAPCHSPAEILTLAQSVQRERYVVESLAFASTLLVDLTLSDVLIQMMYAALNQRLVPVGEASASSFTILRRISVSYSSMEAVEEMITNLTHDQNAFQHVVSKKKKKNHPPDWFLIQ